MSVKTVICVALISVLLYLTFNEIFPSKKPVKTKEIPEEVKTSLSISVESLKTYSALELKENFYRELDSLKNVSAILCEDWTKTPFKQLENCTETVFCQIPGLIQQIQDHIEDDMDISAIISAFGSQLQKQPHKIVEKIFKDELKIDPLLILLDNFTLQSNETNIELANIMESTIKGLAKIQKQFHFCLLETDLTKQILKKEGVNYYAGLSDSFSQIKSLVVHLSYHLSVEKARIDFHLEEAHEFSNLVLDLRDMLWKTRKSWNEKDDEFKTKYSACAPAIPDKIETLIENLLVEANDPIRYSRMKEDFKQSCSVYHQILDGTLPTLFSNPEKEGLPFFNQLIKAIIDFYPKYNEKCTKHIQKHFLRFEFDNVQDFVKNYEEEYLPIMEELSGVNEWNLFLKWFNASCNTLCTEFQDKFTNESIEVFEEEVLEIELNIFLILLQYQMMLGILFYLCPKLPFALYVIQVTLIPCHKHLFKKWRACSFKKDMFQIYSANEDENQQDKKKRRNKWKYKAKK